KGIDLWNGWRARQASIALENEIENLTRQLEEQTKSSLAEKTNGVPPTTEPQPGETTTSPKPETAEPNEPITTTGRSVKEPVTTEPTTGQTQEPSRTESEGTETKATKP